MIFKKKFLTSLVLIAIFLTSCDGFRKAVTGSKKPKGDEFLVIKKEPLVLPPDYQNLPTPDSDEQVEEQEEENNVKEILGNVSNNQNTSSNSNASESLENSILKKINKN